MLLDLMTDGSNWIIDLYDFYMHGDLGSLERANGIQSSDVWFLLNGLSPTCCSSALVLCTQH